MNHEGQSWECQLPLIVRPNQQADSVVSHQPHLSIRRLYVVVVADHSGPGPCILASTTDDLAEYEESQTQSEYPIL